MKPRARAVNPMRRAERYLAAGAWTAKHWRGLLLAIWLGTVSLFGLLAWLGYRNRDDAFGVLLLTVFGFLFVALILRYPRTLFRSARSERARRRGGIKAGEPGRPPVIDVPAGSRRTRRPPLNR